MDIGFRQKGREESEGAGWGEDSPARLQLVEAPLGQIVTPGTGREPDADLRESMARYGLLEPLDIRARPEGDYELIGGSRRRIAARGLGWATVTAIVEPAEAAAMPAALKALLLNLHRESLQQIHLAIQAQRVMAELGCNQTELARRLRMGRSTVSQLLSVARRPDLAAAVRDEGLSFAAAKRLLGLGTQEQQALLTELRAEALRTGKFPRVREVEARVRELQGHRPLPAIAAGDLGDLLVELEARAIPARVQTFPGKQSHLEVHLWLNEADSAALDAAYAGKRDCSLGGTPAEAAPATAPLGCAAAPSRRAAR